MNREIVKLLDTSGRVWERGAPPFGPNGEADTSLIIVDISILTDEEGGNRTSILCGPAPGAPIVRDQQGTVVGVDIDLREDQVDATWSAVDLKAELDAREAEPDQVPMEPPQPAPAPVAAQSQILTGPIA